MTIDLSAAPYRLDDSNKNQQPGGLQAFFLAFLVFSALFTLLYSPAIFSGHVICPEVQSINALYGEKAVWTPYMYGGMPFVPDPGTQFYYPLMRLFYALPGAASYSPFIWNAYIILAYVLCGSFCFSYVRLLTNSNFAAAIAAFAYAFGQMTVEITNMPILHTSAWLTAGVLAFELLSRKESVKNYLFAFSAVALAGLSGQPQIFSYSLALWTLYVLIRALILGQKDGWRFAIISLVAITLGTLVSFLQLFQTIDLIAGSARGNFTFADFLTHSMNPLQLIGIFMPYIYGGAPDGIFSQPHFGNFLRWNQEIYLGFIVMFFSLTMVLSFFKNRIVAFWTVIAVGTFLLAFGDMTPLAWIFYHIPPFGKFRCLHRLLIIYSLANAVLAGLCIATIELKKLPAKVLYRVITVLSALFFTAVALVPSIGDILRNQSHKYGIANLGLLPWDNPSIGIPCLLILLSIAACLFFEKNQNLVARLCISVILMCDLGLTSWYSLDARWRINEPTAGNLHPPVTAIKYVPLANANYNRILPVRGGSGTYDELIPNLTQMWHVPTASGYGPLMPTRYGELLNMTEGGFLIPPWHYKPEDRCFDLLSIKYATAAKDDDRLEQIVSASGPNWRKLENLGNASVHENLHFLPRTWVTEETVCLPAKSILSAIKTSKLLTGVPFDPLKTALVEALPDVLAKPHATDADLATFGDGSKAKELSSAAKITAFADTKITIEAQAPKASVLILSNPYYSGWTAKVDGKLTAVFCADYIIQGIVLPAGKHVVEFEYVPPSMLTATSIGLSSLLSALAFSFFLAKRKSNM